MFLKGNKLGHSHVLALDEKGHVWGWGSRDVGQLAQKDIVPSSGSETTSKPFLCSSLPTLSVTTPPFISSPVLLVSVFPIFVSQIFCGGKFNVIVGKLRDVAFIEHKNRSRKNSLNSSQNTLPVPEKSNEKLEKHSTSDIAQNPRSISIEKLNEKPGKHSTSDITEKTRSRSNSKEKNNEMAPSSTSSTSSISHSEFLPEEYLGESVPQYNSLFSFGYVRTIQQILLFFLGYTWTTWIREPDECTLTTKADIF